MPGHLQKVFKYDITFPPYSQWIKLSSSNEQTHHSVTNCSIYVLKSQILLLRSGLY